MKKKPLSQICKICQHRCPHFTLEKTFFSFFYLLLHSDGFLKSKEGGVTKGGGLQRTPVYYLFTKNHPSLFLIANIYSSENELEKSNFSEVRNLTKKFNFICSTLCEKVKSINERLENIEAKNESKQ